MPFRFRKSIRIGKAFRINLSRRGVGTSFTIPGTGMSWYSSPSGGRKQAVKEQGFMMRFLSKLALGVMVLFLCLIGIGLLASLGHKAPPENAFAVVPPSLPPASPPKFNPPGPPNPEAIPPSDVPKQFAGDAFKAPGPPAPPAPVEPDPDPTPKPSEDPRARSILAMAKNHEKDRRIKPAVRSYSEVVNAYPGTTEAEEAAKRIEALGEKVVLGALPSGITTPKADPRRHRRRGPDYAGLEAVTRAAQSMGGGGGGGTFGGGGSGGGSSLCGAPTQAGHPCRNPVAGGGFCYLHR